VLQDSTEYHWSTKSYTYDSQAYTSKIIADSFDAFTMSAPKSQYNMYVSNEFKFAIDNKDNTLTAADFKDAKVLITVITSDLSDDTVWYQWSMVIRQAHPNYQKIICKSVDFLARYIRGDYPNEAMAGDLFPALSTGSETENSDALTVPVPFGTAYIPLKCVTLTQYLRGYLLGPDANMFTVSEVRSPYNADEQQVWESTDADFRIATKTDRFSPSSDWKILFPFLIKPDGYSGYHTGSNNASILTDANAAYAADELIDMRVVNDDDGSAAYVTDNAATTVEGTLSGGTDNDWDEGDDYHIEAPGLWAGGGEYQNIRAKISRNDLSSMTAPGDHMEYVFEDFGVPSDEIDTGGGSSFETSNTAYAAWDLAWNGAYYYLQDREKIVAAMLNMSHSTIDVTTKIELRTLSKTSVYTVTASEIIKGSFSYDPATESEYDSGHIAFQETGKPQDEFYRLRVPAKSDMDRPSSEVFNIPFVQDSQIAQALGILYYQRKLLKEASISFTVNEDLAGQVKPDQVITISGDDYGGTYDVVVDKIHVQKGLTLKFECTKYSVNLDDLTDLSPVAYTVTDDENVSVWRPVYAGPDSVTPGTGIVPHVIPGKLRVGVANNAIMIDPSQGLSRIYTLDFVSGTAGRGMFMSPDLFEMGNVFVRGLLRMAVLQYGSILAYGGSQYITKSADVLAETMTALDASTLEIKNDSGASAWANGDILMMQSDTDKEWLDIVSSSGNVYTVNRDKNGDYSADANPEWEKGSAIMNFGQSGDGGIYMTADDSHAPYIEIFTHAGSPWSGLTTHLRFGNLNGFLDYVSDKYGLGVGSTSAGMAYDPMNGQRLFGPGITAGSIQSSDLAVAAGMILDLTNKFLKIGGTRVDGAGTYEGGFFGLEGGYIKFFAGNTSQYINWTGTLMKLSAQFYGATAGNLIEGSVVDEWNGGSGSVAPVTGRSFNIGRGGTYRFTWSQKAGFAGPGFYAASRIFRNGVAVGSQQNTPVNENPPTYHDFSDDISGWSPGDNAQLYSWSVGISNDSFIKNLRIKSANPIMTINIPPDV
jgi:hypothetical protein